MLQQTQRNAGAEVYCHFYLFNDVYSGYVYTALNERINTEFEKDVDRSNSAIILGR